MRGKYFLRDNTLGGGRGGLKLEAEVKLKPGTSLVFSADRFTSSRGFDSPWPHPPLSCLVGAINSCYALLCNTSNTQAKNNDKKYIFVHFLCCCFF